MPRVSIVIPTFNRRALLEEAVRSALAQRFTDLEVVVSDNASEDGTEAAVRPLLADPRLRYHRNPVNLGMVGNWRRAVLELARGEWFLILSDDDLLLDPGYVSKAMALADRHPGLALVYAEGVVLDEATGRRRALLLPFGEVAPGPAVFASRDRVAPMDFTLCNVLFRRELAREIGAFDDPKDICCDSVLFLESCLRGDVGVIHEQVSLYRLHGANLLKRQTEDLEGYAASPAYYTVPRRAAVARRALTEAQLAAFDDRARRAIRRAILRVARQRPGGVREFVGHLRRRDGPMLEAALRHPVFQLKLASQRLLGLLRRR